VIGKRKLRDGEVKLNIMVVRKIKTNPKKETLACG
jgi:hypothetical protein